MGGPPHPPLGRADGVDVRDPQTSAGDRSAGIRTRLIEIAGGEPSGPERDLLARLLTSFTTKTPPALDRLAQLLRAGEVTAVQHQAHGLKGSASNLGIVALAGLLAEIEYEARAGRLPDPDVALTALRHEYEQVAPVCAAVVAGLTR